MCICWRIQITTSTTHRMNNIKTNKAGLCIQLGASHNFSWTSSDSRVLSASCRYHSYAALRISHFKTDQHSNTKCMNCNYVRENTETSLRCSLQEPHTQHVLYRRRSAQYDGYIKLHPSSTCFRCGDRKVNTANPGKAKRFSANIASRCEYYFAHTNTSFDRLRLTQVCKQQMIRGSC